MTEISFRSNYMYVDDQLMTHERYSPCEFRQVLSLGRHALIAEMTHVHQLTMQQHRGSHVQGPSFGVMDFGDDSPGYPVLSLRGREYGTGWYRDLAEVDDRVAAYWHQASEVGFIPEVRLIGQPKRRDSYMLFVRDTPYED